MVSLVSQIENYIKRLLDLSSDNSIEVQRSDLAEIFMCVPSQINYVLDTRFNQDLGYYIETRRGGGGYIKIMRVNLDNDGDLSELLSQTKDRQVSKTAGENLISRLYSEELLTKREAVIFKALLDSDTLRLEKGDGDLLRGRMIRLILMNLLRDDLD